MTIRRGIASLMAVYVRNAPKLVRRVSFDKLQAERAALDVLYTASISTFNHGVSDVTHGLIFSCDRAMQLHALMCSYAKYVMPPRPLLTVLFKATSERHASAYRELFRECQKMEIDVRVIPEEPFAFRTQVLSALANVSSCQIFFLVDDMVFIRPIDFGLIRRIDGRRHIFSLRLGSHINYSYSIRRNISLPFFSPSPLDSTLTWCWRDGDGEWDYPLSVDGHVFDSHEIQAMLTSIQFQAPNSMETNLCDRFHSWVRLRAGVCFPTACVVNLPLNCVQHESLNRTEGGSPDDLLSHWEAGEMLDYSVLTQKTHHSVHVPVDERFIPRTSRM